MGWTHRATGLAQNTKTEVESTLRIQLRVSVTTSVSVSSAQLKKIKSERWPSVKGAKPKLFILFKINK